MELYDGVKKEVVPCGGHVIEASFVKKKNGDKVYLPMIFNRKTGKIETAKCYKDNDLIVVDMKNDGTLFVDIEDFPGGE